MGYRKTGPTYILYILLDVRDELGSGMRGKGLNPLVFIAGVREGHERRMTMSAERMSDWRVSGMSHIIAYLLFIMSVSCMSPMEVSRVGGRTAYIPLCYILLSLYVFSGLFRVVCSVNRGSLPLQERVDIGRLYVTHMD